MRAGRYWMCLSRFSGCLLADLEPQVWCKCTWRGCGAGRGGCDVELGHELAVGGAGWGQALVRLLNLQAQVSDLLLELAVVVPQLVDVGGSWRYVMVSPVFCWTHESPRLESATAPLPQCSGEAGSSLIRESPARAAAVAARERVRNGTSSKRSSPGQLRVGADVRVNHLCGPMAL